MIRILLASFNGQEYIAEQLDSLLNQTVQDFSVLVCDDCSTDGTWDVIQDYVKAHPGKITAVRRDKNSGNGQQNFFEMMLEADSDYVMLCDQDDVWLPDKIEKELVCIKQMEKEYGKDTALLVHTDLCVVDRNLQVINESCIEMGKGDFGRNTLNYALVQNTVAGCTAMYNRALSALLIGMPRFMVMHDWFLMLVASAFGVIHCLDEATILYRQHGKNVVGFSNMRSILFKLMRLLNWREIKQSINNTYPQAESFLELYKDSLTREQARMLKEYCEIPSLPKWRRWRRIIRLKTYKTGVIRNIAHFIFI